MQEKVISIDERDAEVWRLITDVPKLKSPWQYVCFVFNVIIPGNIFHLSFIPLLRYRHNDLQLLWREMEQDLTVRWHLPTLFSIHFDRMDLFNLLGSIDCA